MAAPPQCKGVASSNRPLYICGAFQATPQFFRTAGKRGIHLPQPWLGGAWQRCQVSYFPPGGLRSLTLAVKGVPGHMFIKSLNQKRLQKLVQLKEVGRGPLSVCHRSPQASWSPSVVPSIVSNGLRSHICCVFYSAYSILQKLLVKYSSRVSWPRKGTLFCMMYPEGN